MPLVSAQQIEQYHRDGVFILESVIPDAVLDALRQECMRYVEASKKKCSPGEANQRESTITRSAISSAIAAPAARS